MYTYHISIYLSIYIWICLVYILVKSPGDFCQIVLVNLKALIIFYKVYAFRLRLLHSFLLRGCIQDIVILAQAKRKFATVNLPYSYIQVKSINIHAYIYILRFDQLIYMYIYIYLEPRMANFF